MGGIVVGVDGSADADAALRWSMAEARRRKAPLVVLLAWDPRHCPPAVTGMAGGVDVTAFEKAARALLDDCLDQAHEDTVGLRVEPVLVEDAPARALIGQSGDASLVVVGSRGRGGFTSLTLGSVSHQCVHHAACPVAVVRAGLMQNSA
ncbi:conserved hypothetical protein [Frankia canadensis]|uniref:UspA domain-containing protein n=1 Tax=Frankia canadensis TaxID=1836972 RepID=A0A2I2KZ03_9ACTN|nr:universal stress protein [Frankia canadensis]SNQ50893.1 conserved hypothetical protein [Frankia canadensis]SOU58183.1 conserved hypothetical protein [Frankia canadensis]